MGSPRVEQPNNQDETLGVVAGLAIGVALSFVIGLAAMGGALLLVLLIPVGGVSLLAYLAYRAGARGISGLRHGRSLAWRAAPAAVHLQAIPSPMIARVVAMEGHCPAAAACFLGKEFTFSNAHVTPYLCVKGQMGLVPLVEGIRRGTLSGGKQWACQGPHHAATFEMRRAVVGSGPLAA